MSPESSPVCGATVPLVGVVDGGVVLAQEQLGHVVVAEVRCHVQAGAPAAVSDVHVAHPATKQELDHQHPS